MPSKTDAVIVRHSSDVCFLVGAGSLQASPPSSDHLLIRHDEANWIKLHANGSNRTGKHSTHVLVSLVFSGRTGHQATRNAQLPQGGCQPVHSAHSRGGPTYGIEPSKQA